MEDALITQTNGRTSKEDLLICHACGEQLVILVFRSEVAGFAFTYVVEHESFVLGPLSYLVHVRTNLDGPVKVRSTDT